MSRPFDNLEHRTPDPIVDGVELPASTVWPFVLSAGMTLVAAGLVTNLVLSLVGTLLGVVGLVGWVTGLVSRTGHLHEKFVDPEQRARRIVGVEGRVAHLRRGAPGYRFRLPEKVRPISAGIRGGIIGGMVMPGPTLIYGIQSGHGIWFPINLLAATVMPSVEDMGVPELEQFRLSALIVGICIHIVFAIGFGLLYGVMMPTLPDMGGIGPFFWGGVLMPILWTGICYGLMGIVNPVLEQHVDWKWFLVSQFVYGVVMAYVVFRAEKIPVAQTARGA